MALPPVHIPPRIDLADAADVRIDVGEVLEATVLPPAYRPVDRHLTMLVWDVPNIDQEASRIAGGGRPTSGQRPAPAMLGAWLTSIADGDEISATAFANVSRADFAPKARWFLTLLDRGFDVFARPRHDETDDVDLAMVAMIDERRSALSHLVIMSHDRERFGALAATLLEEGIRVSPAGFTGLAAWPEGCTPVDLFDLPGVIADRTPRFTDFDHLPPDGLLVRSPRPLGGRRGDPGPVTPTGDRLPVGSPDDLAPIILEVLHERVGSEAVFLGDLSAPIRAAAADAGWRVRGRYSELVAHAIEDAPFVFDQRESGCFVVPMGVQQLRPSA